MPRRPTPTTSQDQRRTPQPLRGESGVVAIEFALTLPIILIFLFAIIEFGQLFNHLNDSNQIAAAGARLAAVDSNPGGSTQLQAYLAQQADTQDLRDKVKVCIAFPQGGTSDVGYPVKVSTSSDFTLIPLLGGTTLSIKGYATMRIERPPTKYSGGCS